jgi:hypothetical protein
MKFKDFLECSTNEAVISKFDKDLLETAEDILTTIKKENLFKSKVLYRGFSSLRQDFAEITNNRNSFYGSIRDDIKKFILNTLEIKNPTFVTTDITQASMFGKVYIFISENSDYVYSDEVRDILSDMTFKDEKDYDEAKQLYKRSTNIPNTSGEVMVDTKKYFLVDYIGLSKSFKSKFFKPKTSIENLTYQDIYDLIKAYVSITKYKIKMGYQQDFKTMKQTSKDHYEKMAKLRDERNSASQLSTRSKMISNLFDMHSIEYTLKGYDFEFKTQKAAKEAWKILKEKIQDKRNEMKKRNLSEIEFYDGELDKKLIKVK